MEIIADECPKVYTTPQPAGNPFRRVKTKNLKPSQNPIGVLHVYGIGSFRRDENN